MRNNECFIVIATNEGEKLRCVYEKSDNGWINTLPDGTTYSMTAEQFLSHLLPILVDDYEGPLMVRVVRKE